MFIHAQLPDLTLNLTPDVYNGLVNLNQVLVSKNLEQDLIELKKAKDSILLAAKHSKYLMTWGVRGFMTYFQQFFVVLSGKDLFGS